MCSRAAGVKVMLAVRSPFFTSSSTSSLLIMGTGMARMLRRMDGICSTSSFKSAATPATTNCTRAERSDRIFMSSAASRRNCGSIARSNSSRTIRTRVPVSLLQRSPNCRGSSGPVGSRPYMVPPLSASVVVGP